MSDTARIHALIRRGRRRLRLQGALDGAALATVAASSLALIGVYLVRRGTLPEGKGGLVIAASAAVIVALGALIGALRSVATAVIATRIDRASNLADRLATACAFELELARPAAASLPDETRAMMVAAVADAVAHAGRADVRAATPFRRPRDLKAALAFAATFAVVAALHMEEPGQDPKIGFVRPPAAPRKIKVDLVGLRLCGEAPSLAADGTCTGPVEIVFGAGPGAITTTATKLTPRLLVVEVPMTAPVGKTFVRVRAGGRTSWPRPFEILKDGDRRYQPADRVALEDDDVEFSRDLLQDLRQTAEEMKDPELKAFADKVEALLDKADQGELSKEALLDELAKAEKDYTDGARPEEVDHAVAELEKTGKELQKKDLTKPIGDALEQGDLAKAQEEMKKLAEKLEQGELSDKQRAEASKALDKAAEAFDKREQADQSKLDKQIDKAKADEAKADKERDAAKTDADKQRLAKKADDRRRKREDLEQQKAEREDSEQRRTLKRLHRNMKKAAEEMDKDQEKPENRRQASRSMEEMANETGKVDADKRKMAHQKKTQSQLDDLREAMRRAKKGGAKGAQDRFGRNKRNQDFARRARGGQGQKGAWQPGQKGPGKGQGDQPGGQGDQPGGESYGDGTDPNVMGDATAKSGDTQDEQASGIHGKGPSTRETILSAAQKGFSSQSYRQVYGRYKVIVEEVMRAEKVPSGYKFYVKKYFQKIKPHAM